MESQSDDDLIVKRRIYLIFRTKHGSSTSYKVQIDLSNS